AVLGRGKRIDPSARDKAAEILRLHREDPEALAAYNLEDARLVPEILEREGLLALAVERSRLSGMPLDRVGASVASFDRLYLPELRRRGYVAPSVGYDRPAASVRGGALLEPRPGLWRGVAVFDFKSLYPSLIRTFQLDPLAHATAGEDAVVAPGGARFAREGALLPQILERLAGRRAAARARGDRHADQAIKIMMNALFGVLGTPGCRFFDPELANAITGFGQAVLAWTRDAFEARGVEVLYGDTDSVFVRLGEEEDADRRASRAEALREEVEAAVHARIRADHRVEPHLALELQHVFERLWLPRLRTGPRGSKKRYAGWVDGQLVTVGLEAVRRDWPAVAARLQTGLLTRLFTDRELAPFVAEVVAAVREGRLDDELVYRKRLRKGSVDRYTKSTPPHIQAARKAGVREGRLVRYVITRRGPEPVRHGEPLPEDLDRRHYVERVLRPVAESILSEVGIHFDDLVGRPRQLDLL
ncbi:MAG: DNA polymerase domain-containing protein, partial [Myxococcota bacterium]|nr:DNA polymerase domain-containing protein [Myxococcota bacterium]